MPARHCSTALHKGTDIDNYPVYGKGVRAQISHDLPVKQNRQDSHGDINEKCGKTGYRYFSEFTEQIGGTNQPQGIFLHDEVGQHNKDGNHGADGRGKPGAKMPPYRR